MGATPLHDAAWSGNREIALYLLEHGANVKARHAEAGSQPLAYACIKNDIPMVELLLAHGADLRAADNSGETPLQLAVDRGYQPLAELLIAKGADVNLRDKAGSAPLDEAARRGFRGIVELLLAARRAPRRGGSRNRLHPAQRGRPQRPSRTGGAAARHGADPARRDRSGATPLENAARGRHAEVLDLLLQPGSPALAQAGALLIEAAIKGQTDIADLLIAKGAQT